MKNFRFYSIIFSVFFLLILGVPEVGANVSYPGVAEFLNERGEKLYREGHVVEAIDEFSKALLADPQNKTAQKQLRKLGLRPDIYASAEDRSQRIANLARQVLILEEELSYLEEHLNATIRIRSAALEELSLEKNALVSRLASQKQQIATLEKQLQDFSRSNRDATRMMEGKMRRLEDNLRVETKDVARFQDLVRTYESRLTVKDQDFSRERKHAESLARELDRRQVALQDKTIQSGKKITELEKDIALLKNQIVAHQESLRKQKKEMVSQDENHRKKMASQNEIYRRKMASQQENHRKQIAVLKAKKDSSVQMAQLKEELRNKDLEVQGLEVSLSRQDSYRWELEKQKKELKLKESRIAALNEEIGKLKSKAGGRKTPASDMNMASLKEQLAFLRAEYESSFQLLSEKERMIKSLKEQLSQLNGQLAMQQDLIDDNIEDVDYDVANLRNQLEDAKVRLLELQTRLDEKDGNIVLLGKRIEETEQRLELVQRIIREKDDRIKTLEEQLSQMQESR